MEQNSRQNFDFLSLKIRIQVSFWRDPHHEYIIEFYCNLKIRDLRAKACLAFLLF